jgi:hypothetical protein
VFTISLETLIIIYIYYYFVLPVWRKSEIMYLATMKASKIPTTTTNTGAIDAKVVCTAVPTSANIVVEV